MVKIDATASARRIPPYVLAGWPDVPRKAWQWVSPRRLRAEHHVDLSWQRPDHREPNRVTLVVTDARSERCEGLQIDDSRAPIWLSSYRQYRRRDERAIWAHLFIRMMDKLGREDACQDGTPMLGVERRAGDRAAYQIVPGTECIWCGKAAAEHGIMDAPPVRPIPRCVLAGWRDVPLGAWRRVSRLRLRAELPGPQKRVVLVVIDQQGEHEHGVSFAGVGRRWDDRLAYATLRSDLMEKKVAPEIACQDGVPVFGWDSWSCPMLPDSIRLTDRCMSCWKAADQHKTPAP